MWSRSCHLYGKIVVLLACLLLVASPLYAGFYSAWTKAPVSETSTTETILPTEPAEPKSGSVETLTALTESSKETVKVQTEFLRGLLLDISDARDVIADQKKAIEALRFGLVAGCSWTKQESFLSGLGLDVGVAMQKGRVFGLATARLMPATAISDPHWGNVSASMMLGVWL